MDGWCRGVGKVKDRGSGGILVLFAHRSYSIASETYYLELESWISCLEERCREVPLPAAANAACNDIIRCMHFCIFPSSLIGTGMPNVPD